MSATNDAGRVLGRPRLPWTGGTLVTVLRASVTSAVLAAVLQEIDTLAPWYELARETKDRTTFGVCGLDVDAVASFLHSFFEITPDNPVPDNETEEEFMKRKMEELRKRFS